MEEPQEVTDRRWRFNLMGAVESIANAKEPLDLEDGELIPSFFDCISDDCSPHGSGAMSEEEVAAARKLCHQINDFFNRAPRIEVGTVGRIVPKPLETQDFVALGWFDKVQPLAVDAFAVFMRRGWLNEGLWTKTS